MDKNGEQSAYEQIGYFGPNHQVSEETNQKMDIIRKNEAKTRLENLEERIRNGEEIDLKKENVNNYPGYQASFCKLLLKQVKGASNDGC